jgi:hypothetical protein
MLLNILLYIFEVVSFLFERDCILDGIRNFKVCHGISRLHFEYDTSEKDIIKEIFTITGDEN